MLPRAALALLFIAPLLAGCVQSEGPAYEQAIPESIPTSPEAPRLDFSWDPRPPIPNEPVTFTLMSDDPNNTVADAHWDFGDGTAARGIQVTHAFRSSATYAVAVTVIGDAGWTRMVSADVSVYAVDGQPPSPEPEPPEAPIPDPIILATSEGPAFQFSFEWDLNATAVHWDFGDGSQSTQPSPAHHYLTAGTYLVTLEVEATEGGSDATLEVDVAETTSVPRVVVGVTDSGINPYHEIYYRPDATAHPCTYVEGYEDCAVQVLNLTIGPEGGTYEERVTADADEWNKVTPGGWYWIPKTNFIGVHCPDDGPSQGGSCILDDETDHGTGTTSSVLTEVPEALLVFNEGSSSTQLATAPVPIDIESNSWGTVPLYGGFVNGPTGSQICHDSIDDPVSIKFRSAGNNGPIPNMGDCFRNGYRAFSVSGGYPDGSHGELSGSAPDFASYWCRPVAAAGSLDEWRDACGTSFAAPTAAGTAAGALLDIRKELDYTGASSTTEVAPGLSHEAFMDAVILAATYDAEPRSGYPPGGPTSLLTSQAQWYWWGWGWLDSQVTQQIVDCAMGRLCPDNKPSEAWTFNDMRRSFASDGEP